MSTGEDSVVALDVSESSDSDGSLVKADCWARHWPAGLGQEHISISISSKFPGFGDVAGLRS